jgi:hypothetical protein
MADYLIFHLFCLIAAAIFGLKGSPVASSLCIAAAALCLVANSIMRLAHILQMNNNDRKW